MGKRAAGPSLWLLIGLIAGGMAIPASAQQSDSELSYLRLFYPEEVVSASKSAQSASDAPAKVVVITSEQIRRRGYVDLEEMLHDLAGFDFNKGMGVNWSTIFMRGIRSDNSERFLLIWDGVIQNDIWKQTNWISRQYPLTNIDRIEVMYGPSSLLWGANAFAGIINVILKKETDVDGLSAWVSGGSYDTLMAEVNFGKEFRGWRFMLNARYFESDEMDLNGKYWTDAAGRRRPYSHDLALMDPDDPRSDLRDLDGDGLYEVGLDGGRIPYDGRVHNPTKDWFVQAGAGYGGFDLKAYYWVRDEAEDYWYTSQKRSKDHLVITGSALHLSYVHTFSDTLSNRSYFIMRTSGAREDTVSPSFEAHFTGDANDPRDLSIYRLGDYLHFKIFAREYRLGTQFDLRKNNILAVFGAEWTKSVAPEDYSTRAGSSEPWSTIRTHDERNIALFGTAQVQISDRFSLAGGVRYDHNSLSGEEGGYGDHFTFRGAALYSPRENHTLKLIYGQSYQAPILWNRYATDPGVRDLTSPDLKPEELESLEFTYDYIVGDRWRTSLSAYFTKIDNLIRLVNVPYGGGTTNKFENIASLEIQGLELETRYFFDTDRSVFLNATATRAEDPDTGRKTGDIAPFKANLGLEAALGGKWFMYLRGHYVSGRDTVNHDSGSIYVVPRVDSYFAADLALTWLDFVEGFDLKISLYNIFDESYYDPGPRSADGQSYNAAVLQEPFHAFVGVSYRF